MKKSIALIVCFSLGLGGYVLPGVASASGVSQSQLDDRERDKARVVSRLEEVGYSEEEAVERVSKMTANELQFFARHPESIERTGFIILGSLIGSSIYSSVNSGKKKKQAEIDARIAVVEELLEIAKHKEMLAAARGDQTPPELVAEIEELRAELASLNAGEAPESAEDSDEATPADETDLGEGENPDQDTLDEETGMSEGESLDQDDPAEQTSMDDGESPVEESPAEEMNMDGEESPDQDNLDE